MSRLRRAWLALTRSYADNAQAVAKFATTVTSPRNRGEVTPHRTVNRDQPLTSTIAPPGARQQWQLYRVREESRDLELRSPIWGGYVRFMRVQCVGNDLARLLFDRQTKEQKARLVEVTKHIRQQWNRYQMMRGVGGTGRTIHQMAGNALHHVDVDGDCFLTPRLLKGRRVWDLHPGDALAEGSYRTGIGNDGNRQLGVETDAYGRPIGYYFRNMGRLAPLNVEYTSFGNQGGTATRFDATQVQHIRDKSGEITAVRGWPRCHGVIEYIARLDEWFASLVRSAGMRASIGFLLERDGRLGMADALGSGGGGGLAARSIAGEAATTTTEDSSSLVRPYQEFEANAGSMATLDQGLKPHPIPKGAPSSQEAMAMEMLMQIVASSLRVSPATLFGNYKAISFSAGQLAALIERQNIEDRQMILAHQYYEPIYRDWLMTNWMTLMSDFGELEPSDLEALMYPTIGMRKYQILDKGRMVKPLLDAWAQGLMTYPEMRAELGYSGANIDDVIEEWKENRRALGLPETPETASMGGEMPPGKEDDEGESDEGEEDDDDADA